MAHLVETPFWDKSNIDVYLTELEKEIKMANKEYDVMTNKSDMEIAYENYLQSDDIEIEIDGVKYYKIIMKSELSVRDGIVTICVPAKAIKGNGKNTILDENGKKFNISGPTFCSFRGEIPRWYHETLTVVVNDIREENEIGSYIALINT